MRKDYTVVHLCQAFGVSRSGYYEYLNRPAQVPSARDSEDILAIQRVYNESGGTYGAKRIAGTLKGQNHIINHKRVAHLMKEMNLQSKIRKVKTRKVEKVKAAGYIYPNLLKCAFNALLPNKKWVMDVTEILINGEKLYLSAMMDLYNREVISFEISHSPNTELMEKTIRKAMDYRDLENLEGVMIHTDQGNLYRTFRYNQLARILKFTQSMSRKANCWDNAVIESFFSHLKTEFPFLFTVLSAKQLKRDLPLFVEYFNKKRSQKRLGYLSPSAFLATHIKYA